MADNSTCSGCRQPFKKEDIVGLLPNPQTGLGPKKPWHLYCHHKEYYRSLDRQEGLAAERARKTYGDER